MTHLLSRNTAARLLAPAVLASFTLLASCGEKEDPQANLQPAPAPAPVQPRTDPLKNLDIDPRVEFPAERAPSNRAVAQAIADVASAIASGDSGALIRLLDRPSQATLTSLVDSGAWQSATGDIELVRVVSLEESGESARVGLAVQDPNGAYLLGWQGQLVSDDWLFSGIALADEPSARRAIELDNAALAEAPLPEAKPEPVVVEEEPEDNRSRRNDRNKRKRNNRPRSLPGAPGL